MSTNDEWTNMSPVAYSQLLACVYANTLLFNTWAANASTKQSLNICAIWYLHLECWFFESARNRNSKGWTGRSGQKSFEEQFGRQRSEIAHTLQFSEHLRADLLSLFLSLYQQMKQNVAKRGGNVLCCGKVIIFPIHCVAVNRKMPVVTQIKWLLLTHRLSARQAKWLNAKK